MEPHTSLNHSTSCFFKPSDRGASRVRGAAYWDASLKNYTPSRVFFFFLRNQSVLHSHVLDIDQNIGEKRLKAGRTNWREIKINSFFQQSFQQDPKKLDERREKKVQRLQEGGWGWRGGGFHLFNGRLNKGNKSLMEHWCVSESLCYQLSAHGEVEECVG